MSKKISNLETNKPNNIYDWGALTEYDGLDIQNLKNEIVEAINKLASKENKNIKK